MTLVAGAQYMHGRPLRTAERKQSMVILKCCFFASCSRCTCLHTPSQQNFSLTKPMQRRAHLSCTYLL